MLFLLCVDFYTSSFCLFVYVKFAFYADNIKERILDTAVDIIMVGYKMPVTVTSPSLCRTFLKQSGQSARKQSAGTCTETTTLSAMHISLFTAT